MPRRTKAQRLRAQQVQLELDCKRTDHRWMVTGWQGDFGQANGAPVYLECKRCGLRAQAETVL